MSRFIAAAIQTNSTDDIAENIAHIGPMAKEAVAKGARFLALPENAFAMRREGQPALGFVMDEHEGVRWTQLFAREHKVWVLIGSIRANGAVEGKPYNRSVLVSPDGVVHTHYDKIHLFDVVLPDGTRYEESSFVTPGNDLRLAPLPWLTLGVSICYDLRFAGMYRQLAEKGAEMLAVPSAFTRPTGEAHWEVLLRARAIENVSYVIAPAQCGTHPGGRTTYGHSLIIDPWGTVLAEAGDGPEVILAEIDPERVKELRAKLPVLAK